jgi:threonylcarbamoyladenosine tRNA methylthiotransferase MtaB
MNHVAFHTLGCKLNFSETSTIARLFEERGYRRVEMNEFPEVVVINTCSVTDNADRKCRAAVREAQRLALDPYIVVIGCYAQLKPTEIAGIPGVNAVLGASEKFRLLELLEGFEKEAAARVFCSPIAEARRFNSSFSLHDRTRTFLKVQDGCDYSCSFCTIPLARGGSRSDSIASVLTTAREIAARGVHEIVLTGVNTGDFGIRDGERVERFADLLRALGEVEGIARIRISSIEPNLLSDEIIELAASSKKLMPHFHMPLQSGCDNTLRRMQRRYLTPLYATRVERIKSLMPHACIGVDVIVGFPGESDEEFLQSYHFINQLDISYLHVFPYSERDNTPAAAMPGAVSPAKRQNRAAMLRTLSDKKRRLFYLQQMGQSARVLFENDIEEGRMHGFTENYVRVAAPCDPALINRVVQVRLEGMLPAGTAVAGITYEAEPAG